MSKLKKWLSGIAVGIAALFGAHKIQPPTIEHGTPPQSVEPIITQQPTGTSPTGVPSIKSGSITALPSEVAMVTEGFVMANKVASSECFHQFVLKSNFTQVDGETPGQIWRILSNGPVTVNVVMFMGTYRQNYWSKTVGYEDEPGTVYMNRFYVDSSYAVADNLMHEGLGHSKGYSHYDMCGRFPCPGSEPYGMNDAFEACAPELGIKE